MSTSPWGNTLDQEQAVRRQDMHKHLQRFTRLFLDQVSSLPKPDYRLIQSDHVSIGWNLISQRVFVYQRFWWDRGFDGSTEKIRADIRSTMLLMVSLNEEPGHVTGLVIAERVSPIIEGVRTEYSMDPIYRHLRMIRNLWRPPEVQALYDPKTGRPIVNPISSLMHGLPEMPGAHELVMTPPRRYLVEEGELPWRT